MSAFDKSKYRKIVKEKYKTYDNYVEILKGFGLEKSREAVTKWGQDNSPNVPITNELPIIAKSLNVEIIELYTNANEIKHNITQNEIDKNLSAYKLPNNLSDENHYFIPKLNFLAGAGSVGFLDINATSTNGGIVVEKEKIDKLNIKNLRAIEIVGDSMEPEFYEKDIALIDMVNNRFDFVKIAGIYIVRVGNEVYIKRIEFLPNGGLRLMSINRAYGDIIVSVNENYEILGKVCGKIHYEIFKGLTFDNQGIK